MDIGTTLLEYGADTNAVTRQGISPIHLAAQEGSVDLVSLLLTKNANVNMCNKVKSVTELQYVWLLKEFIHSHKCALSTTSFQHPVPSVSVLLCAPTLLNVFVFTRVWVCPFLTERTYTTPLSSSGGQGQCCRSPS